MRVSAIEGHHLWAPTYDSAPNPLLALESRVVSRLLDIFPGLRCVDVACGTGRWMFQLSQRGAAVLGLDRCEAMLGQARRTNRCGSLILGDAMLLPIRNDMADLTLCSFAAGYFSDLPRAAREMARVTRRHGRVVITDLHPIALAAGWTRSFRLDSVVYDIDHFDHTEEQFRSAGERAGLKLEEQIYASFGEPERTLFKKAGKEDLFYEMSKIPAVWIGVWNKP